MKSVSVRQMSHEGASSVVAAARREPVLITKNNEPAVWMVDAAAVARAGEQPGDDAAIYRAIRSLVALQLYKDGAVSIGRAARLAGTPLAEFIMFCGRSGVAALRAPREEIETELAELEVVLHRSDAENASEPQGREGDLAPETSADAVSTLSGGSRKDSPDETEDVVG